MKSHLKDLKPWERDAVQRLLIVGRELADAEKRIDLACMLASLPATDAGVFSFACSQGRVSVTRDGVHIETNSTEGGR